MNFGEMNRRLFPTNLAETVLIRSILCRNKLFLQNILRDFAQRLRRLHIIAVTAGQIGQGNDPNYLSTVHHRQPPHLMLCHQMGGAAAVVVRRNGGASSGHNIPHGGLGRIVLAGNAAQNNVTVGDHAAQAAVIAAYRQSAYVMSADQSGGKGGGGGRLHRNYTGVHQITNQHEKPFLSLVFGKKQYSHNGRK